MPAGQIQSGSFRRRGRYPVEQTDVVAGETFSSGDETGKTVAISVVEVDGDLIIDPLATVQRGRGKSGNHTSAARPQPRRLRANDCVYLDPGRNVDIAEYPG